jgi:putative alpha-1,2-mannosidase
LQKVKIEADSETRLKTFYTALYHTMIAPSIFNDHNGDYLGTDKKIYKKASFTNLTTFSLWDTYRAANPLFTVLQPNRDQLHAGGVSAARQVAGVAPDG